MTPAGRRRQESALNIANAVANPDAEGIMLTLTEERIVAKTQRKVATMRKQGYMQHDIRKHTIAYITREVSWSDSSSTPVATGTTP